MAPKTKFFPFEGLVRGTKISQQFLAEYQNLPRNSGRCNALWMSVVRFQGIVEYIRSEVGKEFNFGIEGFLSKEFVAKRAAEEKSHLPIIEKAMKEALGYIHNFIGIRRKELQDFGENAKVLKQDKRINKNYDKTLKQLQDTVNAWFEAVREEFDAKERGKQMTGAVQKFVEAKVRQQPIFTCTVQLISDLKERLKLDDKNVVWKRVEAILPAIEDINASLNHASLMVIIDYAKQRMLNRKGRNKGKRKNMIEAEVVVPGLNSIGPFSILSIGREWKNRFNFDRTATTLKYSCDLSEDVVDQYNNLLKEKIVNGMTSPTAAISITDKETLTKLKIPAAAAHYAFVYPISFEAIKFKVKKGAQNMEDILPVNCLLSYGGYVYYDKDYRMIQLNALKDGGDDLYFAGPYTLDDDQNQKVKELLDNNRFSEITIPGLHKAGARHFAWLKPGELGSQNHGCFLYLYANKEWSPTYFEVVNQEVGRGLAIEDNAAKLDAILKSYNPEKQ